MFAVRGGARAWLLAGLCAAGCGDDGTGTPSVPIGELDASGADASRPDLDAAAKDAALASDADPSQAGDAGTTPGGGMDGGEDSGLSGLKCVKDSIAVAENTFVSPTDPIAVSMRNDGAILSWVIFDNGHRRVSQVWFNPLTVDSVGIAETADSNQTAPASATTASGFLTVWSDDLNGVSDLRVSAFDQHGAPGGAQDSFLTSDTASDDTPTIATGADGNVLVVWQSAGVGRALLLSANGAAIGTPHDLPSYGASVGRPALARLAAGYALAWVDAASRHVHMQMLDASGTPIGTSSVVDSDADAQGGVALATNDMGGAVVFDVLISGQRAEVRFRAFDTMGAPSGSERVVTQAPDTGLSPSIVPLRGGYALAYRSSATADRSVRLLLLDRYGAQIAATDVAAIQSNELSLALRVSPDEKRLFLGWVDRIAETGAYNLQRAWMHCD